MSAAEEESQRLEDPPNVPRPIHLVMGLEKGIWDECYKLPVEEVAPEELEMLREHNSRHCLKMNSRTSSMHKSCVTLRYLFETRWAPYRFSISGWSKGEKLPIPKPLLDEDEIAVNVFVIPTISDQNGCN